MRGRVARAGLAALLLAALLVPPAQGSGAEDGATTLPGDPLAGRQVFLEKACDHCHAVWGEGGTLGPDLGKGGMWRSVMQLAGVLWNHSPEMIEKMRERRIARPSISSAEMANLAAFLYYLDYFDPPGDPVKGESLFAERGCGRCHAVGGRGGRVGPRLDGLKRFASPLFLAGAMWTHGPAMARKMAETQVPRPRFEGADLADILAYVQRDSAEKSGEKVYMVPGSPARGGKVFAAKGCVDCHAVRGAGGRVGPDLGNRPLHRSVTEMAGQMWNHEPTMWAKMQALGIPLPEFSEQDLSDLIAYLFFLQYFDPPGNVERGKSVYLDKGCVLCHYAPAGTEKLLAPDLSRSRALASPMELSSAMWNHAPVMETQFRERGLPWPRFSGDEVRDLVAYLLSASPPANDAARGHADR
jgi:mono/diheme cytochrome c family protein